MSQPPDPTTASPDTSSSGRGAKRDSLFLLAELCDGEGRIIGAARVRNLSATGLMAQCDHPLAKDARVRLTLRGVGEIGATICWVRDGCAGMHFDEPIDPMAVRRPIARSTAPEGAGFVLPRFSRK